jgi:hypothetical protein
MAGAGSRALHHGDPNMSQTGVCKLTGESGKFVESHLMPKALTRPAAPGLSFIEGGLGRRPVRRWDSWFDCQLTIRKAENILRDLDTWAMDQLRKHELVWSGWKNAHTLSNPPHLLPGTVYGVREIYGIDPVRLRLFFLSLLWRAAATSRPEFSAVSLPADDLEQLRQMLVSGNPEPPSFYPAQLIQLYTRGEIHNHTPIALTKTIHGYDRQIPIFRFYLDGLVTHIHRQTVDAGYTAAQGSLTVGNGDRLTVTALPYETSFQHQILTELQKQAAATWPEVLAKLNS